MGFCFYDFLHDGFRMKYFIYKLGDSKDIDKNVEKKIQRKISYIWLLVIMMICSYCISRNLAEYSSECTLINYYLYNFFYGTNDGNRNLFE